ncbi:Uncharacterised protein [Chlamydia trachomatis]|nr:Uncharacterised protein [Chlamydia trachomatis]
MATAANNPIFSFNIAFLSRIFTSRLANSPARSFATAASFSGVTSSALVFTKSLVKYTPSNRLSSFLKILSPTLETIPITVTFSRKGKDVSTL